MTRIYKQFLFDAAHSLQSFPPGHPNTRLHGHSFRVIVQVDGEPDPGTGMIADLGSLAELLAGLRDQLDHRFLNEIEDLAPPTLENIAAWIWRKLEADLPGLAQVEVHRDSCAEGCIYTGPQQR